jgi:hypothetical protein
MPLSVPYEKENNNGKIAIRMRISKKSNKIKSDTRTLNRIE